MKQMIKWFQKINGNKKCCKDGNIIKPLLLEIQLWYQHVEIYIKNKKIACIKNQERKRKQSGQNILPTGSHICKSDDQAKKQKPAQQMKNDLQKL